MVLRIISVDPHAKVKHHAHPPPPAGVQPTPPQRFISSGSFFGNNLDVLLPKLRSAQSMRGAAAREGGQETSKAVNVTLAQTVLYVPLDESPNLAVPGFL